MDNTTKTTSTEFIPEKQSSTRQSLEAAEVQSEVSIDYAGASRKTDPEEIALVKKLDLCTMPFLWILCFMNIFNRQAISVARLDSLEEDLGINNTQFSTAVSVHYASYILGQIPSNLLLTRVRPAWYICGAMALTSITTMLNVFVVDNTGLILQRFFLGIISAPYYPGAMYMISMFYKRKEIATRISILFSANILATAFQGLIAAPIYSELGGARGLSGWRWMYLIMGAWSLFFSIAGIFFFPNKPATTWWLSPEQKTLAADRIAADTVGRKEDVNLLKGLRQCLWDRRVWAFMLSQHLQTATSSFRIFLPTLIGTLGFSRTVTLVLTCPPYILAGVASVLVGLSSGRLNERTWHITVSKLVSILGFVLACATLNTGARYFAAFVFVAATYPVSPLNLSWTGITCGQTSEKRAASLAAVNTLSSVSLIWTPYLWPDSAAPRYVLPMATSAGICFATIALSWLLRWDLMRENKKMRQDDGGAKIFYAY
ncbi:major facilitator superfamily domain-containing protein [Diaporthe sp. PMI_573]|nr:major facilitator superfamily domain-containing protein [Diaporthaceae sp. PMI_573]